MSKLSTIVVSHAKQLMVITDDLKVEPKYSPHSREYQLFWRYQSHFPQEFTKAIIDLLPIDYTFVSYDHLRNELHVLES